MGNFGRIDKSLAVPLYQQLKSVLLVRLQHGDWKPNDKLPTEDELGRQFGVSKATVRQALQELTLAGLVRREQGRGTFVADHRVDFGPRRLTSFTEEMHEFGLITASRVLEHAEIPAEADVAEKLRIDEGVPVFRLRRLRLAGEEPMGIQTVHIACHLAPRLQEVDFGASSLYDTLENRYGFVLDYAEQNHFAVALDRDQAELLGVPEGAPALGCERLTFMRNEMPLELTRSILRGDRYQIRLRLVRNRPS